MKLKCAKHDQRVFVLDGVVIHRNGTGGKCSYPVVLGDKTFSDVANMDNRHVKTEKK